MVDAINDGLSAVAENFASNEIGEGAYSLHGTSDQLAPPAIDWAVSGTGRGSGKLPSDQGPAAVGAGAAPEGAVPPAGSVELSLVMTSVVMSISLLEL